MFVFGGFHARLAAESRTRVFAFVGAVARLEARAAAVVAPTGTAAAEGASGYQETGHVKRYYDTTRI